MYINVYIYIYLGNGTGATFVNTCSPWSAPPPQQRLIDDFQ